MSAGPSSPDGPPPRARSYSQTRGYVKPAAFEQAGAGTERLARVNRGRMPFLIAAAIAIEAVGGVAIARAVNAPGGRSGPKNHIQPSGRKLEPVGKMTRLGNFTTGGALTAD